MSSTFVGVYHINTALLLLIMMMSNHIEGKIGLSSPRNIEFCNTKDTGIAFAKVWDDIKIKTAKDKYTVTALVK